MGFIMKYTVTYKFVDYDAETKADKFKTWKEACRFMKGLLDDGYEILGVNG